MNNNGKRTWLQVALLTALTGLWSVTAVAQDTDGDGVPDAFDNCSNHTNPAQTDSDGDLYGNRCDPDFDNNMIVNFLDVGYFANVIFTPDPVADLDGNGSVNFLDFAIVQQFIFIPPGPTASGATYSEDTQSIFAAKCMPCHSGLGLGGHNIATTYVDAFQSANHGSCADLNVGQCTIKRIQAGQMPPGAGCSGNPDTDSGNVSCLNYDEQLAIKSWINGGLILIMPQL